MKTIKNKAITPLIMKQKYVQNLFSTLFESIDLQQNKL